MDVRVLPLLVASRLYQSSTLPSKGALWEERARSSLVTADSSQTGLSETEIRLKRAAGLGATPNVVPVGQPVLNGEPRSVHVGWHPVGGFAGKWFAEQTGLGKLITEKINSYPDPTQHWAVLVGDYAHQLWMVSGVWRAEV